MKVRSISSTSPAYWARQAIAPAITSGPGVQHTGAGHDPKTAPLPRRPRKIRFSCLAITPVGGDNPSTRHCPGQLNHA
jgi:hypothetical protein